MQGAGQPISAGAGSSELGGSGSWQPAAQPLRQQCQKQGW